MGQLAIGSEERFPPECPITHPQLPFLLTPLTARALPGILLAMQPVHFEQAVVSVLGRDNRFDAQAYFFLKDALDFTLKRIADGNGGHSRHVSGPELLAGFRDFTLDQFGPMGSTLMKEWGIRPVSYTHLTLPTKRIV